MNGAHPVYWPGGRIVHLPECADGCTLLRRPLLSRQAQEENRALMAACLCEACQQRRDRS